MSHPLRIYRAQAGLTLLQLARVVEVTKTTLSRIETGKQSPSLALMQRIQAATGGAVTPNDFAHAPRSEAA